MNPNHSSPLSTAASASTDQPPGAGQNPDRRQAESAPDGSMSRGVLDRRMGLDRRDLAKFATGAKSATEAGAAGSDDSTGTERRRGAGRRRTDFTRSAEEGEMTPEQFHFIAAIDAFKRTNSRMFPTWTDVLEVVRLLGYRKTMPSELNLRNAEDWREKPDAPSNVRAKPGHPEAAPVPARRMAA